MSWKVFSGLLMAAAITLPSQLKFKANGTGAGTRNMSDKESDMLHVNDFCVASLIATTDGVQDNTTCFTAAVAAAVAAHRPLWLGDAKIYLSTQAASINTDGLVLIGARQIDYGDVALGNGSNNSVNWDIQQPSANIATQWDVVRGLLNATNAAVIYSKYNGPIFTGKALSGYGFTVIGYPGNASNSAFVTTTCTTYPGWNRPFVGLHDASFFYFGSHGLWAKCGAEVHGIHRVQVAHAHGSGLYITQTVGINSPIEFLEIDQGAYAYNLGGANQGNIALDGVGKHINIHDNELSGAGQLNRRCDVTYGDKTCPPFPALESDIVYPIYLRGVPSTQSTSFTWITNIAIKKNFTEFDNSLVKLDPPSSRNAGNPQGYKYVEISDNYLIPLVNTTFKHTIAINEKVLELQTERNFNPYGPIFWLDNTNFPASVSMSMFEQVDDESPAVFNGPYTPTGIQMARGSVGYTAFNGQSIPNNTLTRVFFHSLEWELYVLTVSNSGTTSWLFTAPAPGLYLFSANVGFAVTNAGAVGTVYYLQLEVNGSLKRYGERVNGVQTVGNTIQLPFSALVAMNKGDTADVAMFQNSGTAVVLTGNSANNYISITRVGSGGP